MRLKCIKLAGFKSFVDPTTVNFPSNLGAVVGPNGCGKSNIIDAVRWVMGESSAKNLRGESMTDVIFNGSGGRKPVGQASIELVFDNTDGTLVGEYAGFSEISIKRKVTRDSQNSYYLNGTKCRRRDITDIFLGTGLGPRSYAIIEQGMISRLIESKPEELRVYIEEAAGISKYKERRRDTENRMRRTRENLERLTDIRDELERQLSRLHRQSQSAEKYTEFKKEERQLKAQLQALRFKLLDDKASGRKEAITTLELQVESYVSDQLHHDAAIERFRSEFSDQTDKLNSVQGRFYSIGSEIARIEQTIQHSQERSRQLQIDIEQNAKDLKESEEHLLADQDKAENWQAELLEIEPELEIILEAEDGSSEALEIAEEGMQNWQQAWDDFNQTAAEPRQKAEVQQSKIQHLDQVQTRLLERITKLDDEKASLVADEVDEEIDELNEQLAEIELLQSEKQEKLETISVDVNDLRTSSVDLSDELDKARSGLQSKRGRHASLEALQQAALDQQSDTVSKWLEKNGLGSDSCLAESIEVESGWETAVETALGDSLQAICTEQFDSITSVLSDLTQGEVILLDAQSKVNDLKGSDAAATKLIDKVSAPVDLNAQLSGIYAVETLPEALAIRHKLSAVESVITRDGVWLGSNWLRVARDCDATSGVIARKQELESLTVEIESAQTQIDSLSDTLADNRESIKELELTRESLRREADDTNKKHAQIGSELSAKKVRVEQVSMRRERVDNEIEEAREQMKSEAEGLSEARAILEESIEAMERDTELRETLLTQRDDIRAKLDEARQRARHDKDRGHQLEMRHQAVKTQLDSIRGGLTRLEEQIQRLTERRETLRDGLEDQQNPAEEHKLELEALLEKRLSVEEELAQARRTVEKIEHDLREVEKEKTRVEQDLQTVRSRLEQERLAAQTFEVQRKGIQDQLEEDNFHLPTLLEHLPEDASEQPMEEELERIGNRITRLGPINLAAIDEYKIESERKNYLDSQNEDLVDALDTLENAIKKIDRETRTRFKETFDQVNSSLQELFPQIFGGGHAYLELTGDDLLDTGITIMARPPGKRNSTIHLLSGGEKALTAIALVFSIFRLNPAPFCMLDEVDAPLDDANVGRYARMVEKMSEHVQFIYITHNKIAMEMAHQLLGVTMHEPGVSRLVSVDVDEAAELAAS